MYTSILQERQICNRERGYFTFCSHFWGKLRLIGAPAGAEGGAAARRVAFLRKKLRKNLFGKRFFGVPHGVSANMAVPVPEGARPVFADGKDRQRWAFLWVCPFFFGWDCVVDVGEMVFSRL